MGLISINLLNFNLDYPYVILLVLSLCGIIFFLTHSPSFVPVVVMGNGLDIMSRGY